MSERYAKSDAEHAAACKVLPGGVNSPARAYKSVGRAPITIAKGKGCKVWDIDGNEYIDYVSSYGPLILGHAYETVVAAINKAANNGTTYGMPTSLETQMGEKVTAAVESVEVVRFVNSGTEAVMSAIRLARGYTGKSKVIKCTGGYHGHVDGLLVQAGSGLTTLGTPSSPGVPASMAGETLLMPYNDLEAAKSLFDQHGDDIAAVIIEPIAGNMGCVPPIEGYLEGLRELCDGESSLLIFDEVMTGFRVDYAGAQTLYGVSPDLTTMGKVIGGGLPCAAYGGREKIMRQVSPDGAVYQAGTLSGNPLAMAAGHASLEALEDGEAYKIIDKQSEKLEAGLIAGAAEAGVSIVVQRVGSMLTVFFSDKPVVNYEDATACDTDQFAKFFNAMLDLGVTLPPSQFEAWFVSTAHDDAAIEITIEAAAKAFKTLA